jgi:hypothetical protein
MKVFYIKFQQNPGEALMEYKEMSIYGHIVA